MNKMVIVFQMLLFVSVAFVLLVYIAVSEEPGGAFLAWLTSSWWGVVTLVDLYFGFGLACLLLRKIYKLNAFRTLGLFCITCVLGNVFLAWIAVLLHFDTLRAET